MNNEEMENTMSNDKTETPAFVPGGLPPEMKIDNLDRLELAEIWLEMLAVKNGLTALTTMQLKLDAEKRIVELQAQTHVQQGTELEAKMNNRLQLVREKYNLPDGYSINTKTGEITPPEQQAGPPAGQPGAPGAQAGAPLVQLQPGADPGLVARSAATNPAV